ncbi:hypothetical protein [Xanthocytophaga flava]|uniref:hypothetical protein n=1 Tax=Xanthocytophaga flava TaxID=3048013 RepID=UPI0028D8FEAB|nr:hypothetical protein [Xanthocytophaga flavus]MDJ1471582.1 hypothetical protein [Xanthocytophaga flavus]
MQTPKRFAFPSLRKIADLIYKGQPLLSHFVSEGGEHYLFYWIEGDLLQNRWLVCRVRLEQLVKYTDRKLSLQNIFLAPPDGFLYSLETDNGSELQYRNVQILFPADIPARQLPPKDSLYKGNPHAQPVDLLNLSAQYDSGLLQIHFSESPKVGYGTIDLSLLAPALNHLYEIADGLGLSYYKKQTDTRHLTERFVREDHKKLITTASHYELLHTLPGSFTILLRPRNQQLPMFGQESEPDKFSRYWYEFIQASFDFEKLKVFADQIDGRVVTSYQNLLKLIKTNRLQLQLKWANHYTQLQWQQGIGYQDAGQILENLNRLEYLSDRTIQLTGKFVALNIRSNLYVFEADDKSVSKGMVTPTLHASMSLLYFNRRYEVVIQRVETKQAGKPKPKTKDLLISFAEIQTSNRTLFQLNNGLIPDQEPF